MLTSTTRQRLPQKREFPTEVVISIFTRYLTLELQDFYGLVATSALHDSKERFPQPKCHPSTRTRILQRIFNWAESDSAKRILWLSGSPGAGKSAIAQTIAERCKQNIAECCEQKVRLAAALFFFRSSSERSTSVRLVATLAYEITLFVPGAKEFITKAIMDDPAIFKKDINSQLLHLIIRPLALAAREWNSMQQLLIIIDGLDECTDEIEQSDILSAISNALATSDLPIRFFITSRPESHIRTRFERTDLQSATVHFVLDIDETATQDIATYLTTEVSRIRQEPAYAKQHGLQKMLFNLSLREHPDSLSTRPRSSSFLMIDIHSLKRGLSWLWGLCSAERFGHLQKLIFCILKF